MDELSCFRCLKLTVAARKRRRVCVERQFHRPSGDAVVHDERVLLECADCHTLVMPEFGEV